MQDIFRALPGLVKELEDDGVLREALVFAAWRRAAGDLLRERTEPVSLAGTTLTVAVVDDAWKTHLEDLSGQMIFKVNAAVGSAAVRFIRFVVDEALVNANSPKRRETVDNEEARAREIAEITPELRLAADEIEDEKMRELFLRAAGSCLIRRRRLADSEYGR